MVERYVLIMNCRNQDSVCIVNPTNLRFAVNVP